MLVMMTMAMMPMPMVAAMMVMLMMPMPMINTVVWWKYLDNLGDVRANTGGLR